MPVVLGGVHATVASEEAINTPGLLGICVGEGEEAMLELVNRLEEGEDYKDVKNFWFKNDGEIIKNENGAW